jgi:hypothetical protein
MSRVGDAIGRGGAVYETVLEGGGSRGDLRSGEDVVGEAEHSIDGPVVEDVIGERAAAPLHQEVGNAVDSVALGDVVAEVDHLTGGGGLRCPKPAQRLYSFRIDRSTRSSKKIRIAA